MFLTITINGDIHIHCDYSGDCGIYDDDFEEDIEMPNDDAEESSDLSPEEAETVIRAVAELIFPLLRNHTDG